MADLNHFREAARGLVARFQQHYSTYHSSDYDESTLRLQFIDPFFRALGWDIDNSGGAPPHLCDVVVERRSGLPGRKKRVDYLFRTGGLDRFVCEAKRPTEPPSRHAIQVQNYAFNLKLYLGVLTNFDELQLYVVGSKPTRERPFDAIRTLSFRDYEANASFLWDLLSRPAVGDGAIERFIQTLPKTPTRGGRQGWFFKPARGRTIDVEFLAFLNNARSRLATTIVRSNPQIDWGQEDLNEAVQRILDRLLFLRICEDRDIDTTLPLEDILNDWRSAGRRPAQLYARIVGLIRQLSPLFNGGLFGRPNEPRHFTESLNLDDEWLEGFIEAISSEDSPYLFSTIPIEILGAVYEQFLAQVLHVTSGGHVRLKRKPEVKKAGGIYYTPQYIVDHIVKHTLGERLSASTGPTILSTRVLDPACGSGSFLIRAFEQLCGSYVEYLLRAPSKQKPSECYRDPQGTLHLTTGLKKRIATSCLYGVDIDPQAVEVAQLSLFLKILEGETRSSLKDQKALFPNETVLPDLSQNIQLGNSLIDFSLAGHLTDEESIFRLRPFDWNERFTWLQDAGGFDVVIGNPPYVRPKNIPADTKQLLWKGYTTFVKKSDLYCCFVERALELVKNNGLVAYITPKAWTSLDSFTKLRRYVLDRALIRWLVRLPKRVFRDAAVETFIFVFQRSDSPTRRSHMIQREFLYPPGRAMPDRTYPQEEVEKAPAYNFLLEARGSASALVAKLRAKGRPLAAYTQFVYGFKTADDEKFITAKPVHSESEPFIASADIERYYHAPPSAHVWYVPERMRRHRKTARPGTRERFESEKILVSRMGDRELACAYDPGGLFVKDAMLLMPRAKLPSLKFLTAVLNSNVLQVYYREYFVTIDVLKNAILALPVPDGDWSASGNRKLHDELERAVDKMTELQIRLRKAVSESGKAAIEQSIRNLDQQIDVRVADLYDLSAVERQLVRELSAEPPIASTEAAELASMLQR